MKMFECAESHGSHNRICRSSAMKRKDYQLFRDFSESYEIRGNDNIKILMRVLGLRYFMCLFV